MSSGGEAQHHRAAAPGVVQALAQIMHGQRNMRGVAADGARRNHMLDRGVRGVRRGERKGLTPAGDAGFCLHPHQQRFHVAPGARRRAGARLS